MTNVYIVGAGGLGREVEWLLRTINVRKEFYHLKGFLDDDTNKHGLILNGVKVVGGTDLLKDEDYFILAIANPQIRKTLINKLKGKPIRVISPKAIIDYETAFIGLGSIIFPGTVITTNVSIGNYNIINNNCTVGHDTIISDYTTLYPNSNVSGSCVIGEETEVGTGAQILQGLNISNEVIIGAGAVVTENLDGGTYIGVPARKIKNSNFL